MRAIGVVMAYTENDPDGQLQVAGIFPDSTFRSSVGLKEKTFGSTFAMPPMMPRAFEHWHWSCSGLRPDLTASNSNFVTTILQSEVRGIPLVFVSVEPGRSLSKTEPHNVTGSPISNLQWEANGWRHCRGSANAPSRAPQHVPILEVGEAPRLLKVELVPLEVRSSTTLNAPSRRSGAGPS